MSTAGRNNDTVTTINNNTVGNGLTVGNSFAAASRGGSHASTGSRYATEGGRVPLAHIDSELNYTDYVTRHNETYKPSLDGPGTRGILDYLQAGLPEFDRPSSKKILNHYPQAQGQYQQHDYLKPERITNEKSDLHSSANYVPTADIRQTKFHKGFQRRHQSDIQQDSGRLARELATQQRRDERDTKIVDQWREYKKEYTFNVLTGEGNARDGEFHQTGKRILNPRGNMNSIFVEHERDNKNRFKNSYMRFGEYPPPLTLPGSLRGAQLACEGISKKESMIIGYGNGPPRQKMGSQGTSDNFQHLARSAPRTWEPVVDKNKSQVVFG